MIENNDIPGLYVCAIVASVACIMGQIFILDIGLSPEVQRKWRIILAIMPFLSPWLFLLMKYNINLVQGLLP